MKRFRDVRTKVLVVMRKNLHTWFVKRCVRLYFSGMYEKTLKDPQSRSLMALCIFVKAENERKDLLKGFKACLLYLFYFFFMLKETKTLQCASAIMPVAQCVCVFFFFFQSACLARNCLYHYLFSRFLYFRPNTRADTCMIIDS